MRKAHLISSIIFILLSVVILYFSNELPSSRRGIPGPAVWPIIISCAMLTSGLFFFIKTLRSEDREDLILFNKNNIRVYVTMGVLVLYFFCMNLIGFVVSSLVLMFGLFTWYGHFSLANRLLFSCAIVGIVYCVFNYALNVPFRFGILY